MINLLKFNQNQIIEISSTVAMKEISTLEFSNMISHMFRLMKTHNGVGLAAPQIGWYKRVIVYGVEPEHTIRKSVFKIPDTVMINPQIKFFSDTTSEDYEGNLCIDGIVGLVQRSNEIVVEFLSPDGNLCSRRISGFESRIVQHEVEQLDGTLFTHKAKEVIPISKYIQSIEH